MNTTPDDTGGYANGDPDAVRAAAPPEPSSAQWAAVRRAIDERLDSAARAPAPRWGRYAAVTAAAVLLAAGGVWLGLSTRAPKPAARETATQVTPAPVAPAPHEPDPLPIAAADDVVIHRSPGDGWLPVGAPPMPVALAFATADEVEVEEPNPAWPNVTISPGDVPMIFAAKPR